MQSSRRRCCLLTEALQGPSGRHMCSVDGTHQPETVQLAVCEVTRCLLQRAALSARLAKAHPACRRGSAADVRAQQETPPGACRRQHVPYSWCMHTEVQDSRHADCPVQPLRLRVQDPASASGQSCKRYIARLTTGSQSMYNALRTTRATIRYRRVVARQAVRRQQACGQRRRTIAFVTTVTDVM